MKASRIFLILLLLTLPAVVKCQVSLPPIFTDNMVIQRDQSITIYGKAHPGETVVVRFCGHTRKTSADDAGDWQVRFPAQKTATQPQTLSVEGKNNNITINNVLIGDLWLCLGQSNMEWTMQQEMHFTTEKKEALQPLIRFNNPVPAGRYIYGTPYSDSLKQRLNEEKFYAWSSWQSCDSTTFRTASAVGYYFAKSIVTHTGIPVGFVNLAIGGAPLETFIPRKQMEKSRQFSCKVTPGNWMDNPNILTWVRFRANQHVGNTVGGYGDDLGLNHAFKPGFAYQCGIQPFLKTAIKGIIIYQGESNSLEKPRVDEYQALFRLMVNGYRQTRHQPQLPFLWVQLSSIDTVSYQSRYWPQFRDQQRQSLAEIRHGGMAVCSDIGLKDNVHPTNKKDVGARLARWTLHNDYHVRIVPSGPLPRKAVYKNGAVHIRFDYGDQLQTSDGKALSGFSLDGKTDCDAQIAGDEVIIPATARPAFVYYGWKPYSNGNLVNSDQLPASTFKIKCQGR